MPPLLNQGEENKVHHIRRLNIGTCFLWVSATAKMLEQNTAQYRMRSTKETKTKTNTKKVDKVMRVVVGHASSDMLKEWSYS